VAFGTRIAVTLVMAAMVVSPVACGGDSGDAGSMRATLTDDACTYEGTTSPAAGMFTIEVENQTEHFGAFALASLAEGSTVDSLQPFLEQAQQQFDRNGTLPALPDYYEQVVRAGVEAGATGALPADVPAGTYALMCFVDDVPTWRVHAAEQLDVTE
jgi:hypothetical protein